MQTRTTASARRGAATGLLATAMLGGCVFSPRPIAVDPDVNFAVHHWIGGLVIDRTHGHSALLVRAPSSTPASGPTHLFQVDGKTVAALWVSGRNQVTVRQTADPSGPMMGQVHVSDEQGPIRLSFELADGRSIHSGVFDRTNVHFEPNALGKEMLSVHDLPGDYRANLSDWQGGNVGWLRVEISQYMASSHLYDGVLPDSLNGPLAAAAVLLLDSQVDNIEQSAVDTWWDDY